MMVAPNLGQRTMHFVERSAQAFRGRSSRGPTMALYTASQGRRGEGVETSIHQLLAILSRRLGMITTMTVCGTVLLASIAWWIPPAYTALAQIGVIAPTHSTGDGSAWNDQRTSQMIVDTHMVMLKSRDFLREVLASLNAGGHASGTRSTPGPELDRRLEEFERRLGVSQALSSRVISIRYTSKDPEEAAEAVNRIVTLYRKQLRTREAQSLRTELGRLGHRIAEIDRTGAATRGKIRTHLLELSKSPATADSKGQLGELEKEARANAQLQVELLRREMEIRQRLEAPTEEVWVVSLAAAPVAPSSLPRWLLIVPGAALLVIGSCFWAVASEQLDQGLRSADDVAAALSLPCAALVPSVAQTGSHALCQHLDQQPFTPYAESIRSIAAAVGLAAPCRSAKIVLLSGSEPGKGTTTLAVGVARYAASIGRRVLLVDLDVRSPGVLRELGLQSEHESVLDLASNDAAPQAVVQRHHALSFDYLPTRPGRIDPLSLIASGKLQAALHAFRSTYDLVLVDGPPALRPETPLLAAMSEKVLLVVKWGTTRREVAQNAVRVLCGSDPARHDPADFMAAVVTQVPMKAHALHPFADAVEVGWRHGRRLLARREFKSSLKTALKRFGRRGSWAAQEGR